MKDTILEPPDGGWGILVCIGMALPFISGLSALPSFGLVFGEFLKSINADSTSIAFITGAFFCALSFAGLLSGSLFKRFSLRSVGLVGGFLYFFGSVAQIFVNSTTALLFAFSVLQGGGFGLIIPTSYTTFNNYFVKKRVVWMSFAQSLIGLGSMLYPVLMQKLLEWYGFRGCLIVLAAINGHAVFGMLLMQPVEWHMRPLVSSPVEEISELKENISGIRTPKIDVTSVNEMTPDQNGHTINRKFSVPLAGKDASLNSHLLSPLMVNADTTKHVHLTSRENLRILSSRSSSITSLGNWTGPVVVSDASPEMTLRSCEHSTANSSRRGSHREIPVVVTETENSKETQEVRKGHMHALVDFLDLTLLKQPVYVNIVLGVSFALYSDIAFFTMQPLYLFELGFDVRDTARIIAIGAAADLGSRIFLAFSAIFIQMPSRYIYLAGAFFTIIARFAFLYTFNFFGMACMTAVMGFLRTWIHVPLPLVFAEYLPKERFGTGYGLFMFLQGNMMFLISPLVGRFHDYTKNYEITFQVLNFFMALCAIPWIIEIVCLKFRRKQKLQI